MNICKRHWRHCTKPALSPVPFYSSGLDPCWIMVPSCNWSRNKNGCVQLHFNLYIIYLSQSPTPFLNSQPHLHRSDDAKSFYNEVPIRWLIRPFSHLSVSSFAPIESWSMNSGYMTVESGSSSKRWRGMKDWIVHLLVSPQWDYILAHLPSLTPAHRGFVLSLHDAFGIRIRQSS